jgi:deoxyribodipyrimidine photo-lyase
MENSNHHSHIKDKLSILWFRRDFRLNDNPALVEAVKSSKILPIYILDETPVHSIFKLGSANKIYLHNALDYLDKSLDNNLNIYQGKAEDIILNLTNLYNIRSICWNRCYEPWQQKQDQYIQQKLQSKGISCHIFNGSYLWQPEDVYKEDKSYYKVFTAYKKKAMFFKPRDPQAKPDNLSLLKDKHNNISLEDLQLLSHEKWQENLLKQVECGEVIALNKLSNFIQHNLCNYKDGRNNPAENGTSKLSSHLHFGEISPQQIWHSIDAMGRINSNEENIEHFLNEIIWREFSAYLLFHFPQLAESNFNMKFNNFPWQENELLLHAWEKGKTGYPIIDAGMRELWQTGYMHNRVRMIVASFLVKNLMIHWHKGRDWFWDCLFDADLANNSASWQWVAGCGTDAAPYFRIFNPTTQAQNFDPAGEYIKKFIPELQALPTKYIFEPWKAPSDILQKSNVKLGKNYPLPIIDLKTSRDAALSAYHSL